MEKIRARSVGRRGKALVNGFEVAVPAAQTSTSKTTRAHATKKYKSDAFEAIHDTVARMRKSGTVSKETMLRFDQTCLQDVTELKPSEIKKIRIGFKISQPVFARYLNASESTVEKWETGATKPHGPALKLLHLARKHGLEILR